MISFKFQYSISSLAPLPPKAGKNYRKNVSDSASWNFLSWRYSFPAIQSRLSLFPAGESRFPHCEGEFPDGPEKGFFSFTPPTQMQINITSGTYLFSPKHRTSPGGTCWEWKVLSKGGLLTLVAEAELTLGYTEELVRRQCTSSIKTLPLPLSLLRAMSRHWSLSPKAT